MTNRQVETVRIQRATGGYVLVPSNPENCPLLAELMGSKEDVGAVVEYELPELIKVTREVAKSSGITVQICGNLKTEPILKLRSKKKAVESVLERPRMIFEGMGSDAAKWGVSDFYDENKAAVEQHHRLTPD